MSSHEKYRSSHVSLPIPCAFISQAAHCCLPRGQCPSGCSLQSRAGVAAFHHLRRSAQRVCTAIRASPHKNENATCCCLDKERSTCSPQGLGRRRGKWISNSKDLTFFSMLLGKNPPTSINTPGVLGTPESLEMLRYLNTVQGRYMKFIT